MVLPKKLSEIGFRDQAGLTLSSVYDLGLTSVLEFIVKVPGAEAPAVKRF
jgi:hypothetical protein